jgi:hypothetical protein
MTMLTRDSRITIKERLTRDPEFADAMLDQLAEAHTQNARLTAASTAMYSALMQWQWAEANDDEEELQNARIARDAALVKVRGD